ncbi:MAG: glycosyltransferase [Deltaproteobacteria bacterium]|nr:glycosyltransferase [Deltaproteobacteria bacterium]
MGGRNADQRKHRKTGDASADASSQPPRPELGQDGQDGQNDGVEPKMVSALLIIYFGLLGVLALFGLHRLALVVGSQRRRSPTCSTPPPPPPTPTPTPAPAPAPEITWPDVAVHLPVYNEPKVAARAIEAAARLQYPGRLEIVVLDDSTDTTTSVIEATLRSLVGAELQSKAMSRPRIRISRRTHRRGYKAGALDEALRSTSAELICIFDADFEPPSDFLLRTIPTLVADPRLALVQARWGHLNRRRRWLTRAQAILLDGHFAVEHLARARARRWFNFNGTAGVWRRRAIEEAGGWRDVTLTEDLDLSYRVQLLGWRLEYLHDVVAPAELPEAWSAFRTQQGRWVRGSVETARLMMGPVLRARGLDLGVRIDATIHLLQNVAYVIMALLAVLLPISVFARDRTGWRVPGGADFLSALDVATFAAGSIAMMIFYLVAARRTEAGLSWPRPLEILFALAVGAGMSLSNAIHVVMGLRLRRSEFVRTPKTGHSARDTHPSTTRLIPFPQVDEIDPADHAGHAGHADHAGQAGHVGRLEHLEYIGHEILSRLRRLRHEPVIAIEIGLSFYLAGSILYAVHSGLWGSIPFLLLYWCGFTAVGVGSLIERPPETR